MSHCQPWVHESAWFYLLGCLSPTSLGLLIDSVLNGEAPSIDLHTGLSPPTVFLLHHSCLISLGISAHLPTQGSTRLLPIPWLRNSLEGFPDLDDDRTYLSFSVFKFFWPVLSFSWFELRLNSCGSTLVWRRKSPQTLKVFNFRNLSFPSPILTKLIWLKEPRYLHSLQVLLAAGSHTLNGWTSPSILP